MREERWQGKLLNNRWEDDDLNTGCFDWLSRWKTAPSHTIADVHELYQQLLPTKLYHYKKTRANSNPDVQCRLCGKTSESVSHILEGCSALAQTRYLARHNAALKILYFEMQRIVGWFRLLHLDIHQQCQSPCMKTRTRQPCGTFLCMRKTPK